MRNGPARFKLYLDKVEQLMLEATKQHDPAFWLYQNGARTPLFMLEGLAKLYGGLHNKKRFGKIEAHFKLLEDGLGSIDYYDAFAKEFAADSSVSAQVTEFVQAKAKEKTAALNEILKKKKWIGEKATRLVKIKKKLEKIDWIEDQDEVKAIDEYYRRSITKINEFEKKYENGFTELETQIHELRRKLRWLSIYPQALQGTVQLTSVASNDQNGAKYLTPDIVNSPFNKMPEVGVNRYVLTFNRDYFLALSWMIAELGKLKDQGLRLCVMNEAGARSKADAAKEIAILAKASDLTREYFVERNLDKMIVGVQKTTPK